MYTTVLVLSILLNIGFVALLIKRKGQAPSYGRAVLKARTVALEDAVAQRTEDLRLKHDELLEKTQTLEDAIEVVRAINTEFELNALLERMMSQSRLVKNVDRARMMVYDEACSCYRFEALSGWDADTLGKATLKPQQVERRYLSRAKEIAEDVFLVRDLQLKPEEEIMPQLPTPRAVVLLGMRDRGRLAGYLVLDHMTNPAAFDKHDPMLLLNIKEHFTSAWIKLVMVDKLKSLHRKKNEFLGIVAHDLRNPIAAIMMSAEVLLEELAEGDTSPVVMTEILNKVRKNSSRMMRMINDLLDISAIEAGRLELHREPFSPTELVQKVIEDHFHSAQHKDIHIYMADMGEVAYAFADRRRMRDVLDNLVGNAIKYTHSGGEVCLWVEQQEGSLMFHVTDNGQGMTEEDLEKVFTAYQKLSARPTNGEQSTGLGLAIAKKIVEAHGCEISVKSQAGEGCTFSFNLPIAPSRFEAPERELVGSI
jgi:signal transduction histidine kinase